MKFTLDLVKVFALVLVCFLWSCTPEHVTPNNSVSTTNNSPSVVADVSSHPAIEPECSPRIAFPLMDEAGGIDVNYFGPLATPPSGSNPWGAVTVVNSDEDLVMEIDMAFGWYVDAAEVFIGPESDINIASGLPVVESGWLQMDVNPLVNATEISIPIESISDDCFNFAMKLNVVQLDFFQGLDESSRTNLWVNNKFWNDQNLPHMHTSASTISSWCIESCGPVTTTETSGNCQGCESENTVTMIGCEKAEVTSCKDLSNVVLLFTDNTFQKFDGLTAKQGTFSGTGANDGKEIARVYVKSGCFQSGDGPGWGLRFDTSCNDDNTVTVPGTGGGGKGKNK